MKTFNTLLFVQTASAEEQLNEPQQEFVHQDETAVQQGYVTEQPVPQQQGEDKNPKDKLMNYLFIALIIVVFYLFLIRPQSKRAKEERKFREALKKGDKIVTSAGIHGKIIEIEGTTVIIETEGQGKLKIEKAAIIKHQPS